jgi:hypothetical protein
MPSLAKLKALNSSSTDDEVYKAYGINKHQRRFNPISKLRSRKSIDQAIRETTQKVVGQFMVIKLYIQLDDHSLSDRQCRALLRSASVRTVLNKLGQHSDSPLTFRFTDKTIQRIETYESGYLLTCRCKVVPNKSSKSKVTHLESAQIVNRFGVVSGDIVLNGQTLNMLVGSARLV